MNDKTVIVTGGAGFVGSHTCKALDASGFLPVVYDNLSNSHVRSVRWGPFEKGSLEDRATLRRVLSKYTPVAILHFAAFIEAGESVRRPGKFYQNNVWGTLSLLEEMLHANIPYIVFSSTAAVYGQPQQTPIRETEHLLPTNPYGNTKLAVERMLADYSAAHGIRYCALRYFNAAGADPQGELVESHDPESHLIPLAIRAALSSSANFRVYGTDYSTPDGTCIRDYIHVSDLAEAHVCALKQLLAGRDNLAANLGTGRGHSVLQVIQEVERATGRTLALSFADRRAGDPPILVADPSLATKELGWTARYPDLATQIEHALASMRRHAKLT